jgi:nitroimidazol reductase NimA-like FMN-containing flavoprotein (pyridoxamine 5'-phosphate oxidase superfamily)
MSRENPRADAQPKESTMPSPASALPTHAEPSATATEGLVALSTADCLRRLASQEVGRIVYTDGGLPAVTPINYVFDGGHILVRTSEASRMVRKVPNTIVAFEVDEVDPKAHKGWSVVVTGPCEIVTDPESLAQIATLDLRPWAEGERNVVMRIATTIVTGYQIAADRAVAGGVG